ncbi:MAG: sulfatase [Phycisphaeraceae bacterium]
MVFFVGVGFHAGAEPQAAAPRPNIVLIMADDLGYGDLSCYGSDFIKTPNIDALAKAGIRFTDYHSNGAVCSPTRASLMTGRYPQRTGVEGVITAHHHRAVGLPLDEVTIAEVLKDAGYATAIFGKWHLGYDVEKFGPLKQGFDTFEGFVSGNVDYFNKIDQQGYKDWWIGEELKHVDGYVTDLINDRGVAWIARQSKENKGQPFFLYLAHGAPHYPLQGPDDEGFREVGKRVRQPEVDAKLKYKQMIESMDAGIGRVVAELEKRGLRENTLIIFCSDNGQAGRGPGSAGALRGSKGTVYEGGHRVPMVMSGAGIEQAGEVSDTLMVGMDLMPTLASFVGAELPKGLELDGVSLMSPTPWPGRELHWVHGDASAFRQGHWKLVMNGEGKPELYKLTKETGGFVGGERNNDLGETNDLADLHPERVKQMQEAHERWLEEVREGVDKVSG